MPQMTISTTNIFTTPYKLVTIKRIIFIIEISIFPPKRIKYFMQLFFRWTRKQGLDYSINLIHIIYIWIFEHVLPNANNYA